MSSQFKPPGNLSEFEIQQLIVRLILETDADGKLKAIRKDTEIVEELAKRLKARGCTLSAPTILSRHRKAALAAGLVRVHFAGTGGSMISIEEKERKLRELSDLAELHVLPLGEERQAQGHSELAANLGKLAAEVFCKVLKEGTSHLTVGIGGGQTMHELVSRLPTIKGPFTITATNFAIRTPVGKVYDSANLAMQVHWRAPESKVCVCPLPPLPDDNPTYALRMHRRLFVENSAVSDVFRNSKEPDVVFVGVGDFNRTSLVIERVYKYLGFAADTLAEFQPVGDINLCLFDKDGNDLTPLIAQKRLGVRPKTLFPDEPHCHPFLIGLNLACFRHLVAAGKKVVIVAGGGQKTEAIHALLNARPRCVNGLVTDEGTLDKLLARYESRGAAAAAK